MINMKYVNKLTKEQESELLNILNFKMQRDGFRCGSKKNNKLSIYI